MIQRALRLRPSPLIINISDQSIRETPRLRREGQAYEQAARQLRTDPQLPSTPLFFGRHGCLREVGIRTNANRFANEQESAEAAQRSEANFLAK